MTRRKNPVFRVPPVTVYLGQVLDLDIEWAGERMRLELFDGWNMLVAEEAEDREPGHGRIFLLPGELDQVDEGAAASAESARTYAEWNRREPDKIAELDTPDNIGYLQGRVTRIGYQSDRGAEPGETEDYDHYFIEEGGKAPKIYTDTASIEAANSALIIGGDFIITSRGIE